MTFDPFSQLGQERTLIRPNFGRSGSKSGTDFTQKQDHTPSILLLEELAVEMSSTPITFGNPLIVAYYPLARFLTVISKTPSVDQVSRLSEIMSTLVQKAEARLSESTVTASELLAARYLMCSFADEVTANTPWGGSGLWAPNSLLMRFFQETWGGEKSFLLMQRLLKNAAEHQYLIGLSHWLILLGFQGQYKLRADGADQLRALAHQLRARCNLVVEQPLAKNQIPPQWMPNVAQVKPSPWRIPLHTLASISIVICTSLWAFHRLSISNAVGPIVQTFARLEISPAVLTQPTPPSEDYLNDTLIPALFAQAIEKGHVVLKETQSHWIIHLTGDANFASGSSDLTPSAREILIAVASATDLTSAPIEITGHSDNVPIQTIQFPSNTALSAERARRVASVLTQLRPALRPSTSGAGEAQPIATNDTQIGRAQNRRVEIRLPKIQIPAAGSAS